MPHQCAHWLAMTGFGSAAGGQGSPPLRRARGAMRGRAAAHMGAALQGIREGAAVNGGSSGTPTPTEGDKEGIRIATPVCGLARNDRV